MTTWAELNKQTPEKKQTTSKGWGAFNAQMTGQAYKAEAVSQKEVDVDLFQQLKTRGASTKDIYSFLAPEKVSFPKEFLRTAKETVLGVLDIGQAMKGVRAITQTLATPIAGALALVPGGASPKEAMKESLRMAKELIVDKNVPFDKGITQAAEQYLKATSQPSKQGGYEPTITNVAALSMLGFFNLFGDPAFEFGIGLRGAKALKEAVTFKKVGQVTRQLPEGTKIVRGVERELSITPDLKIKVQPKTNEVIIKGYKRRFPSQQALPDNQMAQETQDLVLSTREATGHEMTAKFQGEDLVLSPKLKQPIKKAIQPSAKIIKPPAPIPPELQPLAQEARTPLKVKDYIDKNIPDRFRGRIFGLLPENLQNEVTDWFKINAPEFLPKNEKIEPQVILHEVTDAMEEIAKEKGIKLPSLTAKGELTARELALAEHISKGGTYETFGQISKKLEPLAAEAVRGVEAKPPKPTGTGEIKKSRLGIRVKEEAIEAGLVKQLRGLPEYEVVNMKEQAKLATDLINSDFEKAKRIAMGQEFPEGKLLPESVFIAMKNYAKQKKDIPLIRQLAKSHTVEQATFMGQRIRALGEIDPNDPVKIIRDIEQARAKKLKGKKKEALTEEQKKIQREIKAVKKSEEDLDLFINSIQC